MRAAALKASGAEQLAKNDAPESHKQELFDENLRLEPERVVVKVEMDRHQPWDVKSAMAVADTKVELPNAKEALPLF